MQLSDTIFGDDIVHIGPRCHHSAAYFEKRAYARDLTVVRRGWQRYNSLPAFAAGGASDEVNLAAKTAVQAGANRIRADLTGKIDLQSRIDSSHFVVL